jgi:hypothetical protein
VVTGREVQQKIAVRRKVAPPFIDPALEPLTLFEAIRLRVQPTSWTCLDGPLRKITARELDRAMRAYSRTSRAMGRLSRALPAGLIFEQREGKRFSRRARRRGGRAEEGEVSGRSARRSPERRT